MSKYTLFLLPKLHHFEEETKAIKEGLEKFGKCPSRIQLPYFFTFSPALRDIFANNNFKRCMNKVKNDWKRRNK